MSMLRSKIPDFTSSGPVNIPSSIQLYGEIGEYLNSTTTTTQRPDIDAIILAKNKPVSALPGPSFSEMQYQPSANFKNHFKHKYQQKLKTDPYLHHGEIPPEPMTLNGKPLANTKGREKLVEDLSKKVH